MGKGRKNQTHNTKSKKKKKHRPVTDIRLSVEERKKIISQLHQVNKEKCAIASNPELSDPAKQAECEKLENKVSQLGGLNAYQFVSKTSESRYGNFNSSKWVMQQLKIQGLLQRSSAKLQLLDVGALDLNYRQHAAHIECTAIDLNPQKSGIIKGDLLQYRVGETDIFDVVVLSLVLNFAGDPAVRGDLLKRACQLCKQHGYLAIVLPLPCVSNSRYFTQVVLLDMLQSLGFTLISKHSSRKLAFHLVKKEMEKLQSRSFPKVQQRKGPTLNNFCIVLR